MFPNFYHSHRAIIFPFITTHNCVSHARKCFCSTASKRRDVILFPGQGTQFVGMAQSLMNIAGVKQLFETANKVLGYDLLGKCLNGPKEDLDKTIYCQPAVFVASLAALEKYKATKNGRLYVSENTVTAGFSVGELAALVLSKSLTFEDALRLVDTRAKAMQKASNEIPSGMVTISGLDEQGIKSLLKSAKEFCEKEQHNHIILTIANYLYSKGFILAGHKETIDYVLKFGVDKHGASKISQLPVSGAFHTTLMTSAQTAVAEALESIEVQNPQIKVYSNVTGKPYESNEDIKRLLPWQVVEPVKWYDIIKDITQANVNQSFYELGPGRQLAAIMAKLDRQLVKKCKNIEA